MTADRATRRLEAERDALAEERDRLRAAIDEFFDPGLDSSTAVQRLRAVLTEGRHTVTVTDRATRRATDHAAEIIANLRGIARDLMATLPPCTQPAYGVPGRDHCAACCYGELVIATCPEEVAVWHAAKALRDQADALTAAGLWPPLPDGHVRLNGQEWRVEQPTTLLSGTGQPYDLWWSDDAPEGTEWRMADEGDEDGSRSYCPRCGGLRPSHRAAAMCDHPFHARNDETPWLDPPPPGTTPLYRLVPVDPS